MCIRDRACTGSWTRFKAFAIEDYNRHVSGGVLLSKKAVDTTICRDTILAKLSIIPVR